MMYSAIINGFNVGFIRVIEDVLLTHDVKCEFCFETQKVLDIINAKFMKIKPSHVDYRFYVKEDNVLILMLQDHKNHSEIKAYIIAKSKYTNTVEITDTNLN